MSETVYPPVIWTAVSLFKLLGLKIRVEGAERVPERGGAVLVSNHISYLDFIFAGYAARRSRRLVRFMAKKEVFDHRISGPLMRGMHHIPVDRKSGAGSYAAALRALKGGEVVGIFAEATISRSFTIKELKNGAVRMAAAADVPLIPMALWGTQRLWTKGRPRRIFQRKVPITILVGEPIYPKRGDDMAAHMEELRVRMVELLDRAQRTYPEIPKGVWWQPAHLGGTAPTPEEAAAMDAEAADGAGI
ncbi:1-acyl-sn-glycerol-3-phosphate acyltransferase [Thermocatellispora tengchongensis]|uniref:1-acyl-sn-glycerol-3-phosphate acyltransferase n=1 Tax=Thermocatellispora tengchongensis TaxID=1073253 RepID=A0A840P1T9_9ACTN|nr:lysophospholipid acyltransferase family protein [Thermocatellispora tengchongensis]MBB5131861.1 1-acyl-sn-glycerol-3-phosphate acyltransferase [Thermocatellispora tengchongensis]